MALNPTTPPQQTLVALLTIIFTAVILRLVYLAKLHPLAQYPGPLLAKFTDAYAAYHAWRGDIHLDMWRCHQRYGSRVRYGPNRLLFNTAEALHDIYHTSLVVKATSYAPLVHRHPNTLTIRDHKSHARRRKLLAQGVSEKAQRGFEHRVLAHIDKFCRQIFADQGAKEIDISQWCYYLSFDIMADVVFGARYNLLEDPKFRYVTHAIDQSNVRMSALVQMPTLASLKLEKYWFRNAIGARNRFVKFVVRVIKDRLSRQHTQEHLGVLDFEKADVFAHLAAAKDPETGRGFQESEIHAESTTLIIAGSDTSSTALSAVFFYLAKNPDAYAKAAVEVRNAFPCRESIVMGAGLSSCTYLRACIDESLRMSPPVGAALYREILPGGTTVDSELLGAGLDVAVPIYAIHHNPKYYHRPFEYQPSRWLVDDGTGSIARARSAFNPFSIGTRGCLGKGLANTELMLTLATVLYLGDFRLADGPAGTVGCGREHAVYGRHRTDEYQLWDHITAQRKGPILNFSFGNREPCRTVTSSS